MKDTEVFVSVCMITYNHGLYVEHAIKSILAQKTDFKFELIIHDDASPDNTADIIHKYAERYPDIIKTVLQKENQFSKGNKISSFYMPLCKGKYYAFCEGDDYWTDEYKLQKQVDYLEANPEIPAVSNRYYVVDKDEIIQKISHEGETLNRIFRREDAIRLGPATFHPNTIMIRMDVQKSDEYNYGKKKCCILGGHTFMIHYLCSHGGVYIFNDIMGAWRHVVEENGTSYSSRVVQHPISYSIELLDMYIRYRSFFKDEYDFSDKIIQCSRTSLVSIVKTKEKGVSKIKSFIKLMKLLSFKDKVNLLKNITGINAKNR